MNTGNWDEPQGNASAKRTAGSLKRAGYAASREHKQLGIALRALKEITRTVRLNPNMSRTIYGEGAKIVAETALSQVEAA